MKKLSLLLGTLGGGLAGYLFSNKELRKQLSDAKDAEQAARLLGKHLQKDGKKLAQQIQEFIESDEVQQNVKRAKEFAKKTMDDARDELESAISSGASDVGKAARSAAKQAKSKAKRAVKQAKNTAKTATRRMQTQVRKLT